MDAQAVAAQILAPAVVAVISAEASVRWDAWPRLVIEQVNIHDFALATVLPKQEMDPWQSSARPHASEQPPPHQRCSLQVTRCEDMANLLQSWHHSSLLPPLLPAVAERRRLDWMGGFGAIVAVAAAVVQHEAVEAGTEVALAETLTAVVLGYLLPVFECG